MSLAASAPRHRFSVDDYHRMIDAGLLGEDERVELLEGEIIDMAPIGSRHAACVARVASLFAARLGGSAMVWPQNPIRLAELSEPQPDLAVLSPRDDFYASELPGPADVVVVIEVADTSLVVDRDVKAPLYARAGVAELWIVDLEGDAVETFAGPGPGGYTRRGRYVRGDTLEIADVTLTVDEILGTESTTTGR